MSIFRQVVNPHSIDELGPTFIALQFRQLLDIIFFQGDRLFTERNIDLPSRATSTLLFLKNAQSGTVTQIANFLGISHQLAGQRITDLRHRSLIEETSDPKDSRKTLISLSANGLDLAEILELVCDDVEIALRELFAEIEIDVFDALIQMKSALLRQSLLERVAEVRRLAS